MNIWAILLGLGLFVAGIGILWAMQRSAASGGEAKAEAKHDREVIEAVKEHKEVADNVQRLPADDARKRLQRWSRD